MKIFRGLLIRLLSCLSAVLGLLGLLGYAMNHQELQITAVLPQHPSSVELPRDSVLETQARAHPAYLTEPTCGPDPELIVFVQSKTTHFDQRKLVRETWGDVTQYNNNNHTVRTCVFFSLGLDEQASVADMKTLKREMKSQKDILLLNISDTYDTLTAKGLLTKKWLHRKYNSAYVIKTDDDVLLDMYTWIKIVREMVSAKRTCTLVCYVWVGPRVFRDGKYAVTMEQYPHDQYPSFCSGAAYLMTPDSMAAIIDATDHVPLFLRDDPYFTGIIAEVMNIALVTIPDKNYKLDVKIPDVFSGPPLIIHQADPALWRVVWDYMTLISNIGTFNNTMQLHALRQDQRGFRFSQLTDTLHRNNVTSNLPRTCSSNIRSDDFKRYMTV